MHLTLHRRDGAVPLSLNAAYGSSASSFITSAVEEVGGQGEGGGFDAVDRVVGRVDEGEDFGGWWPGRVRLGGLSMKARSFSASALGWWPSETVGAPAAEKARSSLGGYSGKSRQEHCAFGAEFADGVDETRGLCAIVEAVHQRVAIGVDVGVDDGGDVIDAVRGDEGAARRRGRVLPGRSGRGVTGCFVRAGDAASWLRSSRRPSRRCRRRHRPACRPSFPARRSGR